MYNCLPLHIILLSSTSLLLSPLHVTFLCTYFTHLLLCSSNHVDFFDSLPLIILFPCCSHICPDKPRKSLASGKAQAQAEWNRMRPYSACQGNIDLLGADGRKCFSLPSYFKGNTFYHVSCQNSLEVALPLNLFMIDGMDLTFKLEVLQMHNPSISNKTALELGKTNNM